jgi:hypothetical protein
VKIPRLLELEEREVARLVFENKLAYLSRRLCLPDATAALSEIFAVYFKLERQRTLSSPVSAFQLYRKAFEYLKASY